MRIFCRLTLLLTFLSIGGLFKASAAAQTYHLRPPASAIPRTLFGLHIHHLVQGAREHTPWPSIPFGAWRFMKDYVVWENLEPQKGRWDFRTLDKYVSLAQEHRVEVMAPLGYPPAWAAPRDTDPPKRMQDWDNYVRTLATRYKGKILYWELWNEPNDKAYYTGDIKHLVALAKAAYTILKQVDPSNKLVSPAATYGYKGTSWLDSYLKARGGKYADIIGYHFYVMPEEPEAMVPLIERVKQVMAQNGAADKPLWDTEVGWYIQDMAGDVKTRGPMRRALPAREAQGYVARVYILSWAAGVSRVYWYDWDSNTMGLTEPGGKVRKPAAYSYYVTERWLIGARMISCDSDNSGTWVCHITRDGGYNGYIVWNANGPKDFTVPKAWNVQEEQDIGGNTHALNGPKSIAIGPLPILVDNELR